MKLRHTDRWVGVSLAVLYFVMLCGTLDIGFPRDEGFYFKAGELYSRWFDELLDNPRNAFRKETIDKHFAYNGEHPALTKILFGLSWRLFGKMRDVVDEPWTRRWYEDGHVPYPILGLLRESTAFRLPALIIASLLVFMIYRFSAEFFNRRVALAATAAYMFMPHAFWHSHLSCFDIPVTAGWFFTAWAFLKAEYGGGWRWAVITGLAWGLALSVKHNAFFIPAVFLFWWLVVHRKDVAFERSSGGIRVRLPAIPMAFLAMLLISPVVYYVLWPRLWYEPIQHFKWYFNFHAHHVMYWAYYFGWLIAKPPYPWGFSFVMSAMTIPGPTVVLGLVGLIRGFYQWIHRKVNNWAKRIKEPESGLVFFVFLNFFIPFMLIANPKVPVFGGTKHWLPGVPFFAIFVGIGFDFVLSSVVSDYIQLFSRFRQWIVTGVVAAFLVPAIFDTFHEHTNGSTYYNAFFGGRGAMGELRMQREFWGNTAFSALPWLNENAREGAKVNFHDTAWDSIRVYWRDGLLRRDIISWGDPTNADYYLFHWHKEFLDDEERVRQARGVTVPVHVIAADGVPLLNVWARRPPKREQSEAPIRGIRAIRELMPVVQP